MSNTTFPLHFLTEEILLSLGLSTIDLMDNGQWVFSDRLEKLSSKQLSSTYLNHTFLKIKYQTLCSEFKKNAKNYDEDKQMSRVVSILALTQLLEHIQLQSTQAELEALQHTHNICREHLQKRGMTILKYRPKQNNKDILDKNEDTIKATTTQLDFLRVIISRGRRALFWSIPLIDNFDYYGRFAIPLDGFLRTLTFFQACVLVPRFMINVLHLFKHWWSPNKNEQHLSALERHQVHLNMNGRWLEVAYDFGWITTGLLNAFVLIGPLAPFAIYTAILPSSFNLMLHTTRLFIEDNRFKKLECFYKKQLHQSTSNQDALRTFLEQLTQRHQYNQNTLLLRVAVSIGIVSTGALGIWTLYPPLIPFIAGVLSVVITLAGRVIQSYLPKQKDQLKASDLTPSPLLRNTLFSNRNMPSQITPEPIDPELIEDGLTI